MESTQSTQSMDKFEKILKLLSEMINNKNIKTFFTPSGKPKFIIIDIEPIKEFSKNVNLKETLVRAVIDLELPQLVKLALNSDGGKNGSHRMPNLISILPDEDKLDEKAKNRLFKRKLQLIEKHLLTADMKFSYLIKTSNKGYCLTGIDWEINLKTFDDVEGNLPNLKYALLKIKTATSKDRNEGIFADIFGGSNDENTIFTCDISDIEYLIDTLESVKRALAKEDKNVS